MRATSRTGRIVYASAGCVFVGVGVVGYFVPLLPGSVFFIVALWCFKRSSPRLEIWLLENPRIGPMLQDWDRDRSIKRRTKIAAICLIWICLGISMFLVRSWWLILLLATIGIGVTWYLITRKTAPTRSVNSSESPPLCP